MTSYLLFSLRVNEMRGKMKMTELPSDASFTLIKTPDKNNSELNAICKQSNMVDKNE